MGRNRAAPTPQDRRQVAQTSLPRKHVLPPHRAAVAGPATVARPPQARQRVVSRRSPWNQQKCCAIALRGEWARRAMDCLPEHQETVHSPWLQRAVRCKPCTALCSRPTSTTEQVRPRKHVPSYQPLQVGFVFVLFLCPPCVRSRPHLSIQSIKCRLCVTSGITPRCPWRRDAGWRPGSAWKAAGHNAGHGRTSWLVRGATWQELEAWQGSSARAC